MELNFLSAELRDICENRAVALEKLGPVIAVQLGVRLADIDAVETLEELAALYPDELSEADGESFMLRLAPDSVLALQAGNVNPARHEDGDIDWSQLDRLTVTGIEAPNG